jgi:hypothetical protein
MMSKLHQLNYDHDFQPRIGKIKFNLNDPAGEIRFRHASLAFLRESSRMIAAGNATTPMQ